MDHQIRRVDKAFEAVEAQAGKAQPKYHVIPKVVYFLAKGAGCQPLGYFMWGGSAGYPQHIAWVDEGMKGESDMGKDAQ